MDFRRSSCMAIPRPGAAAMQRSSWKVTADTWKRMDIRDTTIFQGSDAVLAGRISVDTLSMPFPKGNSMTTASRQCRESSTATGYSPLRTPLTKSIPVIMKSGSSCVSRRKNLFWRPSGRGWISRSLYGEYSCAGVPLFRRNGYRQSGARKPLFQNRDTAPNCLLPASLLA